MAKNYKPKAHPLLPWPIFWGCFGIALAFPFLNSQFPVPNLTVKITIETDEQREQRTDIGSLPGN
jgi:hypothetical protein